VRIGVNALYLIPGQVGGTEIYLRSLLEAMIESAPSHDYFIFTNQETQADPLPGEAVPQPVRASNRPSRILWEQTGLPLSALRQRIDVLFNPGFTAPVLAPCPQVTVFHDLQHKRHPEHFRLFDLPAWRLMLFASACASQRLIAVSEATRRDLLRYYPLEANRVHIIEHGVDERMFAIGREPDAACPYLLCVSTLHPHKNLERLVSVFGRFRERHPRLRLVLAGMKGFRTKVIEQSISELGLRDAVEVTGWLEREQLYGLYRGAIGFVYPSTFEGFGMPVLEALAAGLPVACSGIEPLRSVAGGTALLFDPHSDDSMLEALTCLITSPPEGGVAWARQFSWRRAAQSTLEVLASAAGLPTAPSHRSSHHGT